KRRQTLSTRSHDELPHAPRRVGDAGGRLRRETLVTVLVTVDHNVCAGLIQGVPQRPDAGIVAVLRARRKARMVPDGDCASPVVARSEIGAQPLLLLRSGIHLNVAVEHDDMPVTGVEGVIASRRAARARPDEHYGPPGRNDGRRFAPGRFGDETTEHRGGDGRQPRGEARYGHPRHADPPERALPASSTAAITLAGQCGSCRLKMPPATSM